MPDAPGLEHLAQDCGAVGHDPVHAEVEVTGIALGSRQVVPGDAFAALPGARAHGARFVGDAAAAGAVAVITDAEGAALVAADPAVETLAAVLLESLGAMDRAAVLERVEQKKKKCRTRGRARAKASGATGIRRS